MMLLPVAEGAAVGAVVCLFGMWAFLKGMRAARAWQTGGQPALFGGPQGKKPEEDGLQRQLHALFSEPKERGED